MNNTPFLFALVLLIVLTASGESRAAQLFINELFHNDNFPETYTKPIPREEKPMLKPTKDRPKIALTLMTAPMPSSHHKSSIFSKKRRSLPLFLCSVRR